MALEKRTLTNGLTVYNDHIKDARTNHVRMYVPYGSYHEQPGQEGIAHVFEHSVFLQTDMFTGEQALDRYADRHGLETNAETDYLSTEYYANGVDLNPSLTYLSQILQHTHFPAEKVKHELNAVRREMTSCLDDINEMHDLAADNAMFGMRYGRSIGGYHDKLDFSADILHQLHNKYYQLGRMALIVTGKAEIDEVSELAEQYFTADTSPVAINEPLLAPTLGQVRHTGFLTKGSSALVSVNHPLTPEFHNKVQQNSLAYSMAERAISTAAFESLRQDRGLSYDGSVNFNLRHRVTSFIAGNVTTDPEKVPAALDAFGEIFEQDSSQYSDDQLLGILARYAYAFNNSYTSNSAHMTFITQNLSEEQPVTDFDTELRKIADTTLPDIRAAIDDIVEYTNTHPRYVHITGNKKAIGKADRIIKQREIA